MNESPILEQLKREAGRGRGRREKNVKRKRPLRVGSNLFLLDH